MFTIYCHTHAASGRKYVGQTSQGLARRWKYQVLGARAGRTGAFMRAIRELGEDAFTHEVLQEVGSQEAANEAERRWIAELNTRVPGGFNLQLGGVGKMSPSERSALLRDVHARMTPEEKARRAAAIRAGHAKRSPEWRSESARRREAAMPPEARSARARGWRARQTPEERAEAGRKVSLKTRGKMSAVMKAVWKALPEAKKDAFRRSQRSLTTAQRAEAAKRGHATRRARLDASESA